MPRGSPEAIGWIAWPFPLSMMFISRAFRSCIRKPRRTFIPFLERARRGNYALRVWNPCLLLLLIGFCFHSKAEVILYGLLYLMRMTGMTYLSKMKLNERSICIVYVSAQLRRVELRIAGAHWCNLFVWVGEVDCHYLRLMGVVVLFYPVSVLEGVLSGGISWRR